MYEDFYDYFSFTAERIYFQNFFGDGFFSVLHIGDLGVKYSSIKI